MHTYLFREYSLEPHITKSGTILPLVLITWSYLLLLPPGLTTWSYQLVVPPGLTFLSYHLVLQTGCITWSYYPWSYHPWSYHLVLPPGLTTWSYHLVLPPGPTVNIFGYILKRLKTNFGDLCLQVTFKKLFGSFWQSFLWIFLLWVYFWSFDHCKL